MNRSFIYPQLVVGKSYDQTTTAYQMLEALQVGKNYTWNLNIQQRLNKGLQLTFTYNGRKSENTPIIHIGRMQLTALF